MNQIKHYMEYTMNKKVITVRNLADDREIEFDILTSPEYAVAYAYSSDSEEKHLSFKAAIETGMTVKFMRELPITVGENTVACGDWCINLRSEPYTF